MFLCVLFTAVAVALLDVFILLMQFVYMFMFVENSALNVMMLFGVLMLFEVSVVNSPFFLFFLCLLTCAVSVIGFAVTETAH
jgi:hypothetical protein